MSKTESELLFIGKMARAMFMKVEKGYFVKSAEGRRVVLAEHRTFLQKKKKTQALELSEGEAKTETQIPIVTYVVFSPFGAPHYSEDITDAEYSFTAQSNLLKTRLKEGVKVFAWTEALEREFQSIKRYALVLKITNQQAFIVSTVAKYLGVEDPNAKLQATLQMVS